MVSKISYLIESIKRKSTLQKWVNEQKELAKKLAYEHRDTIYKRELEDDIKRLDYILPLWEKFKKLRKKSTDYDALINIDRKGYITLQITFPITKEELDKAVESKSDYIKENGKMYSCCCRLEEEVYKVCHERVEKVFSGMELNANGSYCAYGNALTRWVDLVKC